MEFRETQSEGKGFFLSVLDFIGALVLFFIFGCVAYGILIDDSFFGYLGNKISDLLLRFLAWLLEYVILPIAGVVGVIKGIIWIFSGETETIYEYEIPEKDVKNTQNLQLNPPPLPMGSPSRPRRESGAATLPRHAPPAAPLALAPKRGGPGRRSPRR